MSEGDTVIGLQFDDPQQPAMLAQACLIAAGHDPVPDDPKQRRAYRELADDLGDGLDRLPTARENPR